MSQRTVTLGELVEFVLKNRRGNAFKAYHESAIASGIIYAAENGTLRYACNSKGEVCGIVTAFAKDNTLYIYDILTAEKWVFKEFIKVLKNEFVGYELSALRCGRQVKYNTNKLINLILKGDK